MPVTLVLGRADPAGSLGACPARLAEQGTPGSVKAMSQENQAE